MKSVTCLQRYEAQILPLSVVCSHSAISTSPHETAKLCQSSEKNGRTWHHPDFRDTFNEEKWSVHPTFLSLTLNEVQTERLNWSSFDFFLIPTSEQPELRLVVKFPFAPFIMIELLVTEDSCLIHCKKENHVVSIFNCKGYKGNICRNHYLIFKEVHM